jgi:signal peptidase I
VQPVVESNVKKDTYIGNVLGKIGSLSYSFVVLVLVVIAGMLALSVVELPGGIRSYVVTSGSMEPAIETGDIVFIQPSKDYLVDDVITYKKEFDMPFVTHRIVEVILDNDLVEYKTKGDANEESDFGEVPHESVSGKVFLTIPILGKFITFAKSQWGFMLLVVIPAVLIIYNELLQIKGEILRLIKDKKGQGNEE